MIFYEEIKVQKGLARGQMRRLQRHRISHGKATGPTGSQNLSGTMREMCGQGAGVTKRVELAESNRVKRGKE
jgi:hypothetical protein